MLERKIIIRIFAGGEWPKFDDEIYIASVGIKILTKRRAEDRQPTNMVLPAEVINLLTFGHEFIKHS